MARKSLAIGIIILFLFFNISFTTLSDDTTNYNSSTKIIYVDDDNIEGPWDGSREHPFNCIHSALIDSSPGNLIRIFAGTYNETEFVEDIIIDKSVVLKGNGSHNTKINHGIIIKEDDVTIQNLSIDGYWYQNHCFYLHIAITLDCVNNCHILNNQLLSGIYLKSSPKNHVRNNTIFDSIIDCIHLRDSDSNKISHNQLISRRVGLNYMYQCGYLYNSSSNSISNNYVNGKQYGFYFSQSKHNKINYNTIENTTIALYLDNTTFTTIELNSIQYCTGYGIFLMNSNFQKIQNNNFMNNHNDAFFNNHVFNYWNHNYWNKTRILPKIITGTFNVGGIILPWINIDWRPAKKPYSI